jgi:hypothetical protein
MCWDIGQRCRGSCLLGLYEFNHLLGRVMVFKTLFCASPFDLRKIFVATDLGLNVLKLASERFVAC